MNTNFVRPALLCGVAVSILITANGGSAGTLVGPGQDDFDREVGSISQQGQTLQYEFFRPPDHETANELPLVVFLHGYSDGQASKQSRLNDTMRQLVHATQKENDQRLLRRCSSYDCAALDEQLAAYLLVPKIPIVEGWFSYLEMVRDMIDDFGQRYPVDQNRIYLAGYSNGGFATVDMLAIYPGIFAAGSPISGGGLPSEDLVAALRDVPLWFFHGSGDTVVEPSWSTDLYDALVAAGNTDVHLSLFSGGHDAGFFNGLQDNNNQFYPWLFSHSLIPEPGSASLAVFALIALMSNLHRGRGFTPAES